MLISKTLYKTSSISAGIGENILSKAFITKPVLSKFVSSTLSYDYKADFSSAKHKNTTSLDIKGCTVLFICSNLLQSLIFMYHENVFLLIVSYLIKKNLLYLLFTIHLK